MKKVLTLTADGHITVETIERWRYLYDGSAIWVFYAESVTSYDPAAIDHCGKLFKECMKNGLETVVAVLSKASVRMGARLVAMVSKIDLRIVGTRPEARALIEQLQK